MCIAITACVTIKHVQSKKGKEVGGDIVSGEFIEDCILHAC